MAQRQEAVVRSAVFESLRDRNRRLVLAVLTSRVYEVSESDLATWVVAARAGTPLVDVPRDEHRRTLTALCHCHLPRLEAAGLIDRDREAETVRVANHPALRDPGIQRVIHEATEPDDGRVEATFDALGDDRRRLALSVLAECCRPLETRQVARRVAARERSTPPDAVDEAAVDEALVSLEHVHLPKFREAGLVSEEGDAVDYADPAAVRRQWLDAGL